MAKKQAQKNKKKAPSAYTRTKNHVKIATVSAALGAIIGGVVGLMRAPKKGKELRNDVEREAERLWKKLKITKKRAEQDVQRIFGEVTPETLELYKRAKSDLLARVAKYKEQMNKKEFDKAVDTVTRQLTKSKKYRKPLKKMQKEFKGLWKDLKKHL